MCLKNQTKFFSLNNAPWYEFSYKLPRNNNYKHVLDLDKRNRNNKLQDSIQLKIDQQSNYDACEDLDLNRRSPKGCKKICTYFVFDIKHDRRHKARLVASWNSTDTLLSSIYLGVVLLRDIRLILFLAKLNGLEL